MPDELKACPLCGMAGALVEDEVIAAEEGVSFSVICTDENCETRTRYCAMRKDAIELWNSRPRVTPSVSNLVIKQEIKAILASMDTDEGRLEKIMNIIPY